MKVVERNVNSLSISPLIDDNEIEGGICRYYYLLTRSRCEEKEIKLKIKLHSDMKKETKLRTMLHSILKAIFKNYIIITIFRQNETT